MTIHYSRIGAITGGTTGAYGTAVSKVLDARMKWLMGLAVIGVHPTVTAAQGMSGKLRINSAGLQISAQEFMIGPYVTSSPATNESGWASVAEIIPLDIPANGGETITIDCFAAGATTVGVLYEVSAIYADEGGHPPGDWLTKFPGILAARGGGAVDAQQLTTTRTALTNIIVPGWAREIMGYKGVITKTGAITTDEEGIGYFELTTTVSGTDPQELPACFCTSATLGTPVGTGQHATRVPYLPLYIPLPGKDVTVIPYIDLRSAVSTDNRVAFSIIYR